MWKRARYLLRFCEILGCEQGDYLQVGDDFNRKDREHVIFAEVERIEKHCLKLTHYLVFGARWHRHSTHSTATLCRILKLLQAFNILINYSYFGDGYQTYTAYATTIRTTNTCFNFLQPRILSQYHHDRQEHKLDGWLTAHWVNSVFPLESTKYIINSVGFIVTLHELSLR